MPALFVFLLKVNIALIVFWLGYYVALRRLTFYTLNRVYLVGAIIFSTAYPLINVNNFVQKHKIPVQKVIVDWRIASGNISNQLTQQASYWHWATLLFWAGVALFAVRLLMQFVSLYKLYKNSEQGNIRSHQVRLVKTDINPFSFWQSIYINPDCLNPGDLESVLQHEQVHVSEWHTLDILLTEISAVFYWFNPGVWLMKKAVRENIEFITDRKILQKGIDSKAYQYSLLNVTFSATTAAGITNNFSLSTLKKRITMMNVKRSSNVNLARYAFLIPAVLIGLFAVNLSKAELVKQSKTAYKHIATTITSVNNAIKVTKIAAEKKITPYQKKSDTIKTPRLATIKTDSARTDTDKKVILVTSKNKTPLDSVTIVVDGDVVNNGALSHLNPDRIQKINVVKNDKITKGLILVQTKNAPDAGNSKIENFSDKLIFIDGKEATEKALRKLPASDIQSMEVKKSKDVVNIYGDKAANGVLFITTKKAE